MIRPSPQRRFAIGCYKSINDWLMCIHGRCPKHDTFKNRKSVSSSFQQDFRPHRFNARKHQRDKQDQRR